MSEEKNINSHSLKCKEYVWKKFVSLVDEMDNVNTQGQALERLIDVYEEPPKTKILDKEIASQNEDLIKKNQELSDEIDELQDVNAQLKQKIEELNIRIEEVTNSGNDNAMAAQRIQMELDKANETIAALQQEAENKTAKPENIFEVEVHPVPYYFLKKMAAYLSNQKKTEITPGYILTDLFLKDLQNPRANNLPYIVTTAEISKVLEEYRKAHPEEK